MVTQKGFRGVGGCFVNGKSTVQQSKGQDTPRALCHHLQPVVVMRPDIRKDVLTGDLVRGATPSGSAVPAQDTPELS